MAIATSTQPMAQSLLEADRPILVEFSTQDCGPCALQDMLVTGAAVDLFGKVDVTTVDLSAHPDLIDQFSIQTLPTVLLIKDGEIAARFAGLTDRGALVAAVESV